MKTDPVPASGTETDLSRCLVTAEPRAMRAKTEVPLSGNEAGTSNTRTVLAKLAFPHQLPKNCPMRIIDPHVHVWTHDPEFSWPAETTNPPSESAEPEQLLDLAKYPRVYVKISHTWGISNEEYP